MRSIIRQMIRNVGPIKPYVLILAIGGAALVVGVFADIDLCPVYRVLGVPCFSCGMTRAFRSLPDFVRAFAYHPLFFTVPFIPLLAVVSDRVRNVGSVCLIVMFVGVWVVRMVLLFPHTEPMLYNESSLLRSIFN